MFGKNISLNHFFISSVQLLILILLIGKGSALTASSSVSGTPRKTTVLNHLPLNDDVLFTEDVLLKVSARSRIDCSKKCVETEGCVMCTFLSSPQGPPGHCRLHSQLQNLTDAWQNKTGARSFAHRLCEEPYVVSCGRCLSPVAEEVNYTDAQQRCREMKNGGLVMPQTAADVECVRKFIFNNRLTLIWVGADDIKDPGVFRWNDGTLLPDNSPLWDSATKQPLKKHPGGDCVIITLLNSKMYNNGCHTLDSYGMCQKDLM